MTAANTFQFLKNYNNFGKKDQSINIQTPKTGTDIKDDKTAEKIFANFLFFLSK